MNYYNENDPACVEWLHALILLGQIPPGDVDSRSIEDVEPGDVAGYTQCHFFAGIGGWSHALSLCQWPENRPVWTGSCPCQPFSVAGKGQAQADKRHLWPEFRRLIAECAPPIVFGEQVASRLGREWLAGVRAEMEALGYAVGAADLCAASVGAPHIRQRLWWVADANERQRDRLADSEGRKPHRPSSGWSQSDGELAHGGEGRRLPLWRVADAASHRFEKRVPRPGFEVAGACEISGLPDSMRIRQSGSRRMDGWRDSAACANRQKHRVIDASRGHWNNTVWVPCADGKARRLEPGIEPLAHGISARVVRLRGYGNAIVPQVAAAFIEAYEGVHHARD